VASLGVRPTVEDSGRVLLEVHLLDFQGDCYGKLVRVEFCRSCATRKSTDLPTLTAAIARDATMPAPGSMRRLRRLGHRPT
jgi:riboflavin kinase/FMN adenylyltransferase